MKANNAEEKRKDYQLNEKWKTGRPWLVFLDNNTMACNVCINHYGKNLSGGRGQNTFILFQPQSVGSK